VCVTGAVVAVVEVVEVGSCGVGWVGIDGAALRGGPVAEVEVLRKGEGADLLGGPLLLLLRKGEGADLLGGPLLLLLVVVVVLLLLLPWSLPPYPLPEVGRRGAGFFGGPGWKVSGRSCGTGAALRGGPPGTGAALRGALQDMVWY